MKWWYRGRLQCNVISDVEYVRCVATLTVCEMWRGMACSNVKCCAMVVMWNGVVQHEWWCDIKSFGVTRWNDV